ncbi:MAG: TOBE domain-containing protein, partial [Anaerolineales bacterium]
IVQIGTPEDIYDRPNTIFVAQLVGTPRINLVETNREDSTVFIKNSTLHLPIPHGWEPPDSFVLGIRPEDVLPDREGEFAGELTLTEPLGVETILHITSGKQTLISLIPGMTDLRIGENVNFNITQDRLYCFNIEGDNLTC